MTSISSSQKTKRERARARALPRERYTKLFIPGLSLPRGYTARFVENSRGVLWYTTNDIKTSRYGWSKDVKRWISKRTSASELRSMFAIEVISPRGRVEAAFGWQQFSDTSAHTNGTMVAKKLRRRGIASMLWGAMTVITGVTVIHCVPITDYGNTLIKAMKETLGEHVIIRHKSWIKPKKNLRDLRK